MNIAEKPIVASIIGNGSAVLAVGASAANLVQQWAGVASVVMAVALNASLVIIAWRKERREAARREHHQHPPVCSKCGRTDCRPRQND